MVKLEKILIFILVFAFLIRLLGINYGLPMWLIDDEPPFALAALKMIQLKNPIPAFNLEDFKTVLYYPPYLAYAYILPFLALLGVKFLTFSGEASQFIYHLTSDLSAFFLTARFLNVLLGTASVWLAYDAAKNLFKNNIAGLAAAFFLATSLSHAMFSMVGRHWLPVSFIYLLAFWFLTKAEWGWEKRYFSALLVIGLGMGVSPITALFLILMTGWYFLYETRTLGNLVKSKYFYVSGAFFVFLISLPSWLYPASFGFTGDVTLSAVKSFGDLLASPIQFLKPVILAEPVLALFAVIGLLLALWQQKNLFWPFLIFFYGYAGIFYWFFRYEHRFLLPLVPFLAILAGFAFSHAKNSFNNKFITGALLVLFLLPFNASLRLSYLAYHDDSRALLRDWTLANVPVGSKILVYSRLTRLPSDKEAIAEQRAIDPGSLRKVDAAEENLAVREGKYFHALNLYSVSNGAFLNQLENYAKKNGYEYLFLSDADAGRNPEIFKRFRDLAEKGELLESFGSSQEDYSLAIGQLLGNPFNLFKIKELGPSSAIYKLQMTNDK